MNQSDIAILNIYYWSLKCWTFWMATFEQSRRQCCWWQGDVSDFMILTVWRCWWQNHDVTDCVNVKNRRQTSQLGHQDKPTSVSTICLQHPPPTSVTNIYAATKVLKSNTWYWSDWSEFFISATVNKMVPIEIDISEIKWKIRETMFWIHY